MPSFSAYAYFGIGTRLARRISTFLYRVRLGYIDETAMTTVDPDAAVIFVINHRSNVDYVLVTYMASTSSALSYAVGEWARVWAVAESDPLDGRLFRARADSREPLYRKVLSRYVHLAVAGGLTQAMFPEGGLTRDGKLRPPKLGLLSYMVSVVRSQGPRDVVFVPGRHQLRPRDRGPRAGPRRCRRRRARSRASASARRCCSAVLVHNVVAARYAASWRRFGYACVSFGKPVSLRQYLSEHGIDFRTLDEARRFAEIERLGAVLMEKVGEVVPALPVSRWWRPPFWRPGQPLSALELKGRCRPESCNGSIGAGAHIHIPRADQDYAVEVGLRMLLLRHFVIEESGLCRANPAEEMLLRYYANSIAHLLTPPSAERLAPPAAAE